MDQIHPADDRRALWLALAAYVVVFAAKLAAYFASGVIVLLAEALHTLSDLIISGFLLLATTLSRRAADESHAFGHGRAQNVAALVAATLFISFTSFRLYEEAIPRLFAPESSEYRNLTLALAVIAGSMVVAAAPLLTLLRQRKRGPAARAQMIELINDELGLVAALLGTLAILAGYPLADPIAAAVVATIIAVNAVGLLRENASFLLGRSPDAAYLRRLKALALEVEGVRQVDEVRAEYVGPDTIHAGISLRVAPELTIVEADRIAEAVHEHLHATTDCRYCVIHVDPADPGLDSAVAVRPHGLEAVGGHAVAPAIPHSLKVEHEELHAELVRGTQEGGEVGRAAQGVAAALHAHFEREEEFAMPPLGALAILAAGQTLADRDEVARLSATLKAELPQMLAEHQQIVAALGTLRAAAQAEGKPQYLRFADKLTLHAQNEEEVLYPATILVGEYLKA